MTITINYKYSETIAIYQDVKTIEKIGGKLHIHKFDVDTLLSEDIYLRARNIHSVDVK